MKVQVQQKRAERVQQAVKMFNYYVSGKQDCIILCKKIVIRVGMPQILKYRDETDCLLPCHCTLFIAAPQRAGAGGIY